MGVVAAKVAESELSSEKRWHSSSRGLPPPAPGFAPPAVAPETDLVRAEKPVLDSREPDGVSVSETTKWQDVLLKDPKNRLALSALSAANPRDVLMSRATRIADPQVFNIKIPFEGGPITNQRSSGRCWLFASTNVWRVALMRRYGLDSFELSQAYLFFWDKLEKSNWFLEQIIDTAGDHIDSRLVQTMLHGPISDGGQWDMVYNLVEKYGLVPQALYPDSFNASSSSIVNSIVVSKLREYAMVLRRLVRDPATTAAALSSQKTHMMREVHAILTLTLGPPPDPESEFSWTFHDKSGKAREVRSTPRTFARDIYSPELRISSSTLQGMVSLVHDPRHDPLTMLTVDRLGNVVGGRAVTYCNVDMVTLKAACVAMLRAGLPVFFGCDVGKFSNNASGIMDLELIDYDLGFGVSLLGLDKAERLVTGESAMTHAMVLTGVHVVEDHEDVDGKTKRQQPVERTVRWRVQNSWGTTAGDQGWFVMSDAWMDQFVYQAVIDPRFLSRDVRRVIDEGTPLVLPLWDPMGALA